MSKEWKTLKDHSIRRDKDFKLVQFVVAHLKTPFFMEQSFKTKVKNQLIEAANNYSKLLNIEILISSEYFSHGKEYVLRFYKSNFLHLTGVKTELKADNFFNKCFDGTIDENDFDCDSQKEIKGFVRQKLKHLLYIDTIFSQKLKFQENFKKGTISCSIASSDDNCTIGFADAKYYLRPQTLLDKNHLSKNSLIIEVVPKIKKI